MSWPMPPKPQRVFVGPVLRKPLLPLWIANTSQDAIHNRITVIFLKKQQTKNIQYMTLGCKSAWIGGQFSTKQWVVGGFNPFEKYARQIGNLPQIGVKIKNI